MTLDGTLINRAVPPGSMRYYAWLYAPPEQRDVLAALFLIESELHDSAHAPHEVAHIRLQWWREEIDRLIQGRPQHPASHVLRDANKARSTRIDFAPLQQALLSAAQELANATYETDAELAQYLSGGLGSLLQVAGQFLTDTPTATTRDAGMRLGAFIREVETLRDLRNDFHHGRLYLPLDELDKLDIDYEALQQELWPDGFNNWLKQRCAQLLVKQHTLHSSLLTTEKQILRPLLVLSGLHAKLLTALARDPQQHTRQRVELTPLQKLWTAWRTARQAT